MAQQYTVKQILGAIGETPVLTEDGNSAIIKGVGEYPTFPLKGKVRVRGEWQEEHWTLDGIGLRLVGSEINIAYYMGLAKPAAPPVRQSLDLTTESRNAVVESLSFAKGLVEKEVLASWKDSGNSAYLKSLIDHHANLSLIKALLEQGR